MNNNEYIYVCVYIYIYIYTLIYSTSCMTVLQALLWCSQCMIIYYPNADHAVSIQTLNMQHASVPDAGRISQNTDREVSYIALCKCKACVGHKLISLVDSIYSHDIRFDHFGLFCKSASAWSAHGCRWTIYGMSASMLNLSFLIRHATDAHMCMVVI